MNTVTCFLPCRAGSQRVPQKNIKKIAHYESGLVQLKLEQLLNCSSINNVVLSTNESYIIDFAKNLNHHKLIVHHRCDELCSSSTSTDHLVEHVCDIIDDEHILWTHVTSPFVNTQDYAKLVESYFVALNNNFDSLMTVTELHAFLWNKKGPINYNRSLEKWPRTQTLEPLYEINSAAFIAARQIYIEQRDRIGNSVYMHELSKIKGFDIDWEEDFIIAESLIERGLIEL